MASVDESVETRRREFAEDERGGRGLSRRPDPRAATVNARKPRRRRRTPRVPSDAYPLKKGPAGAKKPAGDPEPRSSLHPFRKREIAVSLAPASPWMCPSTNLRRSAFLFQVLVYKKGGVREERPLVPCQAWHRGECGNMPFVIRVAFA